MDYELLWWSVAGVIAVGFLIALMLPWNDCYDKNANDPYRYCPKPEDEW